MNLDLNIFRAINLGWQNPILSVLFTVLSYSGLGQVQVAVLLISTRFKQFKPYFWPSIISLAVAGLVVSPILKVFTARLRPSNLPWAIKAEPIFSSSFPSGHTITSVAIATVIAIMCPSKHRLTVGCTAFAWALGVGLSRIYRGVHWPSDVLGAFLGGILSACIVLFFFPASQPETEATKS